MKDFSPFQIVLISLFVVAALAGLYAFTTFSGFGGAKQEIGKVVIWGTLPQEAVDAGINNLNESGDDYAEVSYVERAPATFSSDLANAIASGSGPDLILISQEELLTERAKLTVIPFDSIPQRTFVNSYLPIFELFLTSEGTYGIPLVVDPLVLYYNRSILASAGIANPPVTWEAVSGLAANLTSRDDRGTVLRSFIPLGEYGNVNNARATLSLLLLQAGSKIASDSGGGPRSTLLSEEPVLGSTPAESAVAFYTQFADPAKNVYSWNRSLPQSRQAFLSGDLILYPGFASERPYLSAANPNLDFDVAAIPQPGSSATKTGFSLAYALALPKQSMNPTGAVSVAYALSSEAPMLRVAEALSAAPARRSLLIPSSSDRYAAVFYAEALAARGWLSPAPYVTDAIFSAMIGNVIAGRADIPGAIQKADQALNAVLR